MKANLSFRPDNQHWAGATLAEGAFLGQARKGPMPKRESGAILPFLAPLFVAFGPSSGDIPGLPRRENDSPERGSVLSNCES